MPARTSGNCVKTGSRSTSNSSWVGICKCSAPTSCRTQRATTGPTSTSGRRSRTGWSCRSCVSKKYNQEAQAEIDRNADMANMLDEVGPHLWAISFRTLPKAMTTAEFQPYVDRATEFYATLPTAADGGDHIPYEWMGEHGLMRLKALP